MYLPFVSGANEAKHDTKVVDDIFLAGTNCPRHIREGSSDRRESWELFRDTTLSRRNDETFVLRINIQYSVPRILMALPHK